MGEFSFSPGLFPGYEFGYDQTTSAPNITGTTQATGTTLITCAAHWFDGYAVIVEFFGQLDLSTSSSGGMGVTLNESGSVISDVGYARAGVTTTNNPYMTLTGKYRFTPTAGLHSYVITAYTQSTTGTPALAAGSGGAGGNPPAYVRFTKV